MQGGGPGESVTAGQGNPRQNVFVNPGAHRGFLRSYGCCSVQKSWNHDLWSAELGWIRGEREGEETELFSYITVNNCSHGRVGFQLKSADLGSIFFGFTVDSMRRSTC